jgi:hypothetical protein
MKQWMAWIGLGAVGGLGAAAMLAGCKSDEPETTTTAGNCSPSDPACPALKVTSDCLGLVDNAGKDDFALRMAQLTIVKPAALVTETVSGIVSKGVNINLPACRVSGDGTFSWLFHFHRTNKTLRTGGAKPALDPAAGYCFDSDPKNGVAPVTVPIELGTDGTFETGPLARVIVGIYIDQTATSAVYLPLRQVRFTAGKVSADQNCIGRFNADGLTLENNCKPDPAAGVDYFIDGASLDGYILLDEADTVLVPQLGNASLCTLLTTDASSQVEKGKCKRDAGGKILLEGDWCSTSNKPLDCKDSFRLEGKIAASAVTIPATCPNVPDAMTVGAGGAGGAGGGTAGAGG